MLCIPKSNHLKLIEECYPPAKNLASIGPEYKPNSNELSRLAYYGNRKPEKLTKVGKVLEQRATTEAKGASGTGASADKAKGALMVTLGIVKELITECHRDINYFASSATSVILSALQSSDRSGRRDLDITARSAATFYALANYLNAASSPVDGETMRQYINLLSQFAKIAVEQSGDEETQNRVRLLGLGALAGAIGSDAFYTPTYSQQLSVIAPALLTNIDAKAYEKSEDLQAEADKIAESGTASQSEFIAKRLPTNSRKVPNFSADTEKSVSGQDVTSAAMGNLHTAIHNGDASHVQSFVTVLIDFFNGKTGLGRQWGSQKWCCWISQSLCSWTALQYRFIIPTNLIEYLADDVDAPVEQKHHTLVAIITTLLSGKLSMIGLSTSDAANNLLGFAVRRVHNEVKDPLLPPLVGAVGALGTHIYYADQLNDLAEEITARIAAIEVPQSSNDGSASKPYSDRKEAKESIRMLLGCLVKLITVAQQSSGAVQQGSTKKQSNGTAVTQTGTRSRISASVFQQTASLLASPDNWVRQSFQEALLAFLATELQPSTLRQGEANADSLGSKLSVEATGFTHAFAAGMYVLAASRVLYAPSTHSESPLEALPIVDRSNKERKLDESNSMASGLPSDYAALIRIVEELVDRIPVASILGLVPALLAINKAAASFSAPRQEATLILVKSAFNKIADVCEVSSLRNSVQADLLPPFPPSYSGRPQTFGDSKLAGQSSSSGQLRADSVISSLSGSARLQSATDLDSKALQNWFARDWSVQIAVDDSYVGASPFRSADEDVPISSSRFSSPAVDRNPIEVSPSKSAMLGASADTSIGVDDFRQALGNRNYAKGDYNSLSTRSNGNGNVNGGSGFLNGGNTLPNANGLDKRASRRASRKISQPIKATTNGHPTSNTVGGLLDSMQVGVAEEDGEKTNPINAPYVP